MCFESIVLNALTLWYLWNNCMQYWNMCSLSTYSFCKNNKRRFILTWCVLITISQIEFCINIIKKRKQEMLSCIEYILMFLLITLYNIGQNCLAVCLKWNFSIKRDCFLKHFAVALTVVSMIYATNWNGCYCIWGELSSNAMLVCFYMHNLFLKNICLGPIN